MQDLNAGKLNGYGISGRVLLPYIHRALILVIMLQIVALPKTVSAATTIHNATNAGAPDYKYGTTWGQGYTCGTCHQKATANIKKIKNYIFTDFGLRRVIFSRVTAATNNSTGVFGNDERTVNINNSTNICEVCHHRTLYHQYSSVKIADKSHTEHRSNRVDCTQCHQHGKGFRRPDLKDCASCHGNPPISSADYGGAAQGLSAPPTLLLGGTFSAPPAEIGAHNRHRNLNGMECSVCHNGEFSQFHGFAGNQKVELGFRIDSTTWPPFTGAVTTGTFTGYSSPSTMAKFAVAEGNPGTILRGEAQLSMANSCSIYCHGDDWNVPSGKAGGAVRWTQGPLGNCENSACHGSSALYPPTPVFGGVSTGGHKTHVSRLGNDRERCAYCHDNYYNPTIHMINGHVKINLSAVSEISTYKGFNQMSTGYLATTGSYGDCANLYCHSNVQSPDGNGSATQYQNVSWGGGRISCGGCHGGRIGDASAIATGSHTRHTIGYGYLCRECHNAAGKDNETRHADKNIDVVLNPAYGGNFSQLPNPAGNGFGSCSGNYCHSDGNGGDRPVEWGITLSCDGCHGGEAGSGVVVATGRHAAHVDNRGVTGRNYLCEECHAQTVAGNSLLTIQANHVNKLKDYSGNRAGSSSSYDRDAGACSATYCHTDGKGRCNAPFTLANGWKSGAILGCNGCHGNDTTLGHFSSVAGEPNYLNEGIGSIRANSHRKHSDAGPGTCVSCHSEVTTTGFSVMSGSLKHINRAIDINKGGAADFVWNEAAKSCSGISCHFSKNATWGDTLNCNSCHGADEATLTTGRHRQHIATGSNPTLWTAVGCAECHAKTVNSNSIVSRPENHTNGFVDYSGAGTGQFTRATGICANVYCHSDGKGRQNVPFDATNGWNAIFSIIDCKGCHGNDTSPDFTSLNGEPNYASSGASTDRANGHKNHVSYGAGSCAFCHATTVTPVGAVIPGSSTHVVNYGIDVNPGNGAGFIYGSNKSCSEISCHGGKGSVTQYWGAGVSPDCTGCHGNNAASSLPIASGRHSAHTDNPAIGSNFNCGECHAATINADERTFANAALHGNSFYDYSGNRAGSSSSYDRDTGACSATYCHTDGKGRRNAPFALANGWKSLATLGCNGCHGNDTTLGHFSSVAGEPNYPNEGVGSIRANSHRKHSDAGPGTCVSCHSEVTTTGFSILSGSLKHTNRVIDINKGGAADFVWNEGVKSCSGISCHFSKNATWGDTLNCNSCHGADEATLTTNKHTPHISTTANPSLGNPRGCAECHAKTVSDNSTISGVAAHSNGFVDYSGPKAGQYSTGTGACANVYCHSDGKGRWNVVFDESLGWRSAFTIPDCKGCHGNDSNPSFSSSAGEPNYASEGAGLLRSNSHYTHTTKLAFKNSASCDYCHTDTVTTDGLAARAGGVHLNGGLNIVFNAAKVGSATYDYQNRTCTDTSCHTGSVPRWGDAGSVGCNTCHGGDAVTLTSKKHPAHISTTANPSLGSEIGCFECHARTVDSNRNIVDQAIHINTVFGDYSGVNAGTYTPATGVCANSYCHSDGKGRQNVPFDAATGWNSSVTYAGCGDCHGNDLSLGHFSSVAGEPNYSNEGAGLARANSHLQHVGSSGALSCAVCHSETVTVAGTGIIGGSLKHINGTMDVKQGGTSFFTWTGETRTCGTINCHFNRSAVWGDVLDCNGCHDSDATALTTGRHQAHVSTAANQSLGNEIGCVECHAKTVSDDNVTIRNPDVHINGVMGDYSGARAGSYSAASGSCANSYCHTDGKDRQNVPFDGTNGWNSLAAYSDCTGCHGNDIAPAFTSSAGAPNYANEGAGLTRSNSHLSHTTRLALKNAASCDYCHTSTVTSDGLAAKAGGLHLSGGINVVFNSEKSGSGSYDYQNRTCANTSCHSGSEPTWGDASSAGCKLCHGNLATNPGFHAIHIGNLIADGIVTFYGYTANRSDLMTYRIGCANCHPTVEEGNHRNGMIEVSINKDKPGAGYLNRLNLATTDGLNVAGSGIEGASGSDVSCKLAYCHSNGRSTALEQADFRASPSWYAVARVENRCGVCHDNPPQYAGQSHYVAQSNQGNNGKRQPTEAGHMIGFHFANTYVGNNANGFLGFSSSGDKAHGNSLLTSTISCHVCHNGIVGSSQIDTHAMAGKSSVFKCTNCHSASTATRLQPGQIVDTTRHLNGVKDVAFPSVTIMSKAQLANPTVAAGWERFGAYKSSGTYDYMNLGNASWDPVNKTCATACHFNREVSWGSSQIDCASCHFDD